MAEYNKLEIKLTSHSCLKNLEKSSNVIESEYIVQFLLDCPKTHKSYVRTIVTDDDTTTTARLQEEEGEKSKGRLPKCLLGIHVLADPSHPFRTRDNGFYKLAKTTE